MPLPPPASTLFPYTTLFRSIASEKGKLLDLIARRYGNTAAREFLDKVTKVGNGFLTLRGFSTSIDDEDRSEEHTSELQSRFDLVCRLLLEKKNICWACTIHN